MSRDPYGPTSIGGGGSRSPRSVRRVAELPTVDRSPSRSYPSTTGGRGSPLGRKPIRQTRSGNNSPDHGGYGGYHHQSMGSPYYSRDDDLGSPVLLDERGRSTGPSSHHRSRSASRPAGVGPMTVRYQSLDRTTGMLDSTHEREFMPIREPRERSLDRGGRDRSLERGLYLEDELYGSGRSARQSPNAHLMSREPFIGELQHQNNDLQRELGNLKKELELTNQKLGSSMHSIKTFWSPELKKERQLRKEESAKYSLINDQLKLLNSENQKQAMLVRQLEEELRMRMRAPSVEMQQQMEILLNENEHLTREIAILRDTIKELELRIETQKQTLQARDESIKKLLEMLQNKGMGGKIEVDDTNRLRIEMVQSQLAESHRMSHPFDSHFPYQNQELYENLDEFRMEIQRRDQEILAMSAKMKTLEEQHQDYQRHIAVLKESLCAKEEHYNMLQADVDELRQRLEEKNRHIEKKTQIAMQATQDRNRINNELTELKDHMDIKDRKINVLQRKLDLHEANKKLQTGGAPPGEDMTAAKKQLEEQRKQLDEQKKNVDGKRKEIEEKEKALSEVDKQLKKRKEQMDQLEASLKKAGGSVAAAGELNKKLTDTQKELDSHKQQLQKAQEEAKRSGTEMERLLQLVQMSQEEQNKKEQMIMELQQTLKNTQQKLKNQQQVNAQLEEQRKKEEVIENQINISDCENIRKENKMSVNFNEIAQLKTQIQMLEDTLRKTKNTAMNEDNIDQSLRDLQTEILEKNSRILQLEKRIGELERYESPSEIFDQEIKKRDERIFELEGDIEALEQVLKDHENITELEELVDVVRLKDDRIAELEEALRESVKIVTEREMVLQEEEMRRKQILDKVGKLEQRLLSLQTAHAMKCHSCKPVVLKMRYIEQRLQILLSERKRHLQDVSQMKQEALKAAISEKDAHLALLEVSGIRNARQADEVEQLKLDKDRLMERLKQENEFTVSLLEEYEQEEYTLHTFDAFEDDCINLNGNNHKEVHNNV